MNNLCGEYKNILPDGTDFENDYGFDEEIDDKKGVNEHDSGDEGGVQFTIHDLAVKWNKMKPIIGKKI